MKNKHLTHQGLQAFIARLENNGELIRVKHPVSPDQDITEIADRMMNQPGGGKALLFENTGTKFPLLINAFGSTGRMKTILGEQHPADVFPHLFSLAEQLKQGGGLISTIRHIWPHRHYLKVFPKHSTKRGACQQVIDTNPDLGKLPVLTSWPFDGGPFFTLPMVFTQHPETGTRNIGMYRMQVFDKNTTGMHWHRHKGGAVHFKAWQQKGGKMPVAVALGGDPLYTYLATAPLPENVDELLMYGLIRKQPATLVKCITQDIEVPADADIILEGYIDTNEAFRTEGPFGDHTGFYSLEDTYPVFHLTAITHRKNAVYPATITGIPPMEDLYFSKTTETLFKPAIKMLIAPEMEDFHLPAEGTAHNLVLMHVKNSFPGSIHKTMHALMGAGQMMFSKILIALPQDVELTDYPAVIDHVAAWIHPDKAIISAGPADELEHASPQPVFGGKLMLDLSENSPDTAPKPQFYSDDKSIRYGNILIRYANREDELQHTPLDKGVHCIVFVDVPPSENVSLLIWWVLANIDPQSDILRINNALHIDARVKPKQAGRKRRWPQPVLSSDDTIQAIDEKWEALNIGRYMPSPSKKTKNFVNSHGAAFKN
ncbi:MAG: menaquinone biosynthesis decarboxylase [Candidatus Delongbacteria bacterium]|nr:menaquinone biosynthesis decarboxylase [Candidatus Delongbacteria bacterium]